MTWKEYIEGRKWYRGTLATEKPTKRRKKTTFWLPDKKDARGYADPGRFDYKHPMQLITAKITPIKLFIGNEPALVRKLGLTKPYLKLVAQGKKWDPATDKLVNEAARRAGYDVQAIGKDQLQVFNPKAIKILGTKRIPKSYRIKVKPQIYYTSGNRLSRKPHKGWRRIKID